MFLLKSMLQVFIYVIAGNTIGAAIFTAIFSRDVSMSYRMLWEIIIIAVICSLGTVVFASGRELSKGQVLIRHAIHYLYINLVVMGGALSFKWINAEFGVEAVFLFLLVAVIYICIILLMYKFDAQTARVLNEKLSKYNKDEE